MALNLNSVQAVSGFVLTILICVNGQVPYPGESEDWQWWLKPGAPTIVDNVISILDWTERCSAKDKFFFAPGTGESQCLKVLSTSKTDVTTWELAKKRCTDESLQLARPFNAKELAFYLYEKYGYNEGNFWVNAKGNDDNMEWQVVTKTPGVGRIIPSEDPLWATGEPGDHTTPKYCMALITNAKGLESVPYKPYTTKDCLETTQYIICEKYLSV